MKLGTLTAFNGLHVALSQHLVSVYVIITVGIVPLLIGPEAGV